MVDDGVGGVNILNLVESVVGERSGVETADEATDDGMEEDETDEALDLTEDDADPFDAGLRFLIICGDDLFLVMVFDRVGELSNEGNGVNASVGVTAVAHVGDPSTDSFPRVGCNFATMTGEWTGKALVGLGFEDLGPLPEEVDVSAFAVASFINRSRLD